VSDLIQPGSFTWTTVGVGLLNLLFGGALVSFIRSRPSLKKIDADREANLLSERAKEMQEMRDRIDKLEKLLRDAEKVHSAEKEALQKQFDAHIAHYRHRTNNLDASFNALLLLLKQGVEVADAVEAVEKMRSEQLAREATELATLRAAGIQLAEAKAGKTA
jgi:hypothetical protein